MIQAQQVRVLEINHLCWVAVNNQLKVCSFEATMFRAALALEV